ncbi:30S ribosome-binding factor RbfA [Verrucomicrobiaceae bacterium R5-34]|uniref:Ribosome-binding factor A n=1 Tax=Oceaniferula flava TaxID=2800421 RepID=A0AAE2SDU2_9BACT|nr:30S ribosome-binding factor RbfA [Oceaniferula flavus]MBK1829754.1 30S ribosome-binding factor RbfA [Verrucomicrobiaceae bacterium R5-34]MBK1856441.1 30S ribosome-binding factor RbfA [Oceaniferula flavus]MBM1137748.1 30S ribosome-binding factor RbfA [Oceaniferula flavus]
MSQRLDRINALLRREISTIVQRDFEFPGLLVTVSEAEITQDLREAKVFISVLGGKAEPVLEQLAQKRGLIQSRIAKRVVLRCTPILDFRVDNSAERGVEMVNILEEVDKLPKAPPEEDEDEAK